MDPAILTKLWSNKDKNGIVFLFGNLNFTAKVMVFPTSDIMIILEH
jgi:hypothetical protein